MASITLYLQCCCLPTTNKITTTTTTNNKQQTTTNNNNNKQQQNRTEQNRTEQNRTEQNRTEQNRTNRHTHTRPKTKNNVARSESTRKQRPTASANPHLREEGRRMKRKRKWSNISPACNSSQIQNFCKVTFPVTAWRIQNTLNENRSQLGFRLAKIGTMFAVPLSTSDSS